MKTKKRFITAEEFDRRVDAGESVLEYCEVITEAEMEKHMELSKVPGRLEAYLAKKDGRA